MRKAFSLPEFAIVIGIVGVVVSLLWNYASNAWDMARCTLVTESVAIVVTNLRTMYGSQLTLPAVGATASLATPAFIPSLFTNGVIPYSMQRIPVGTCANTNTLCADTPWGGGTSALPAGDPNGTFQACSWNLTLPAAAPQTDCMGAFAVIRSQYFGLELKGLSQQDCILLGSQISSSTTITGLLRVYVNAAVFTPPVTPIALTKAPAPCSAVPNSNKIIFVYSL